MMAALASAPVASFKSFDGLRTSSESTRVTSRQTLSCTPIRRIQITSEKKTAKRKQIILTVDVPDLGKEGDLLAVKPGYFRNFLSPYLKAKSATPKILKTIQLQKEKVEAEKRKVLEGAEAVARQFQTVGQFNVRRKQGQGKAIFGTVTSQDITDIIRSNTGKEVDKKDVEVPEIKEVGTYDVQIKLHPEVIATIKIVVVGTK